MHKDTYMDDSVINGEAVDDIIRKATGALQYLKQGFSSPQNLDRQPTDD